MMRFGGAVLRGDKNRRLHLHANKDINYEGDNMEMCRAWEEKSETKNQKGCLRGNGDLRERRREARNELMSSQQKRPGKGGYLGVIVFECGFWRRREMM